MSSQRLQRRSAPTCPRHHNHSGGHSGGHSVGHIRGREVGESTDGVGRGGHHGHRWREAQGDYRRHGRGEAPRAAPLRHPSHRVQGRGQNNSPVACDVAPATPSQPPSGASGAGGISVVPAAALAVPTQELQREKEVAQLPLPAPPAQIAAPHASAVAAATQRWQIPVAAAKALTEEKSEAGAAGGAPQIPWREINRFFWNPETTLRFLQLKRVERSQVLDVALTQYFQRLRAVEVRPFPSATHLSHQLGKGSYSRVFNYGPGKVLKLTRKSVLVDKPLKQRYKFCIEGLVNVILTHLFPEQVVQLYEVIKSDRETEEVGLVFEKMDMTLHDALERPEISSDPLTCFSLLMQVVTHLEALAAVALSHRDIRLSNLMVKRLQEPIEVEGTSQKCMYRVKLMDFGMASIRLEHRLFGSSSDTHFPERGREAAFDLTHFLVDLYVMRVVRYVSYPKYLFDFLGGFMQSVDTRRIASASAYAAELFSVIRGQSLHHRPEFQLATVKARLLKEMERSKDHKPEEKGRELATAAPLGWKPSPLPFGGTEVCLPTKEKGAQKEAAPDDEGGKTDELRAESGRTADNGVKEEKRERGGSEVKNDKKEGQKDQGGTEVKEPREDARQERPAAEPALGDGGDGDDVPVAAEDVPLPDLLTWEGFADMLPQSSKPLALCTPAAATPST